MVKPQLKERCLLFDSDILAGFAVHHIQAEFIFFVCRIGGRTCSDAGLADIECRRHRCAVRFNPKVKDQFGVVADKGRRCAHVRQIKSKVDFQTSSKCKSPVEGAFHVEQLVQRRRNGRVNAIHLTNDRRQVDGFVDNFVNLLADIDAEDQIVSFSIDVGVIIVHARHGHAAGNRIAIDIRTRFEAQLGQFRIQNLLQSQ